MYLDTDFREFVPGARGPSRYFFIYFYSLLCQEHVVPHAVHVVRLVLEASNGTQNTQVSFGVFSRSLLL
jgi:hypothetical protein